MVIPAYFAPVMNSYLVSIIGTTAIGKTDKAIALARAFNTEIVSADSRQFYREMTIGTAVPTPEEQAQVPHHFIQHISVDDAYNVGDFEKEALEKLKELFAKHQCVFLVGGSGLFLKAVNEGLDYFPEVDPKIRQRLNERLKQEGLAPLQRELKKLDPKYYNEAATDNPRRVIRALEICLGSGKPFSAFRNQKKSPRPFKTLKIGLDAPREVIYRRIENRVDHMMDKGLLEEARRLYPQRHKNALNTIGYKELYQYFDGQCSLAEAIGEIKKNTRRFAKRQLTWFRRDQSITWFPHGCAPKEIEDFIRKQIA